MKNDSIERLINDNAELINELDTLRKRINDLEQNHQCM